MSVSHEYITSYKSKVDLLNYIKTPAFFFKMTETLGDNDYKYVPDITLKKNLFSKKYIKWPQSISYNCIPTMPSFLPAMILPETYVNSTFNLVYDELLCDFSTNFNSMEINMNFKVNIADAGEHQKLIIKCTNADELLIPNPLIQSVLSGNDDMLKKVFG